MTHRGLNFCLAIGILAALGQSALAQPAAESQTTDRRPVAAEITIATARKILADQYLLPEVAGKLDQALARAATAGAFRNLSGEALAARVNAELGKVTSDVHLQMRYQPQLAALFAHRPGTSTPQGGDWDKALEEQLQRVNAGVRKLEVLPGNIRYLDYESFSWGAPVAQQAIATAMEFLRHGDAIIIDLRNNAGGSTNAEAAIASYFLLPHTKLTRFEMRSLPDSITETLATPFSLAGKPTFLLIGPATVSAAEALATDAATFGFGKLVGARTRGGGYTIRTIPLPGGYLLDVSVGRALNARTDASWEGTGVSPTIPAAPDKALFVAQATAMEGLLATATGAKRSEDERLVAFYRAQANPVPAALPLSDYVGRYGEFILEMQRGDLTIRVGDFPPEALTPIGANTFAPASEPALQVRFVQQGGAIVALELDSGNGPPTRNVRINAKP